MQDSYKDTWNLKMNEAYNVDKDSTLGVYKTVSPALLPPKMNNRVFELERIRLSRYRTGSHNLRIETGRFQYIRREDRLCHCGESIQTLQHCILYCNMLNNRNNTFTTLHDALNSENISYFLLEMEKTYKI